MINLEKDIYIRKKTLDFLQEEIKLAELQIVGLVHSDDMDRKQKVVNNYTTLLKKHEQELEELEKLITERDNREN